MEDIRNKILFWVLLAGIVFQFSLTIFLGFMFWQDFLANGSMNEMLLGVLTGLATGIGLTNVVNYALDKVDEE